MRVYCRSARTMELQSHAEESWQREGLRILQTRTKKCLRVLKLGMIADERRLQRWRVFEIHRNGEELEGRERTQVERAAADGKRKEGLSVAASVWQQNEEIRMEMEQLFAGNEWKMEE